MTTRSTGSTPAIPLRRTPEVVFILAVSALFTLAVLGGLYYLLGGPIPYRIVWEGPPGAAFSGAYTVTRDANASLEALQGGQSFEATYPHQVTVWGSRRASVVASAQSAAETPTLKTITVHRATVVCATSYRWGTENSVVCDDKHSYTN